MLGIVDTASPINWAHPLNRSLVSWWLALPYQARGVTYRDLVGRNNGTLTSMDPATDWVGPRGRRGGHGSLDFDGSNDHVVIPHSASLEGFTSLSVSVWVYVRAVGTMAIVGKPMDPGNNPFQLWYLFADGGKALWILSTGVSGSRVILTTATSLPLDRWVHLVGTWDGATMRAYFDGQADATTAAFSGPVGTDVAPVWVGRWFNTFHLNGLVDDIRVWKRSLSAPEVRSLYNESLTGSGETLRWLKYRRRPVSTSTVTLTADPGAFTWIGTAAGMKAQRRLSADSGAFIWRGTAATLKVNRRLSCGSGAFKWTGTAATLRRGYRVAADAGAFNWTGTAASLRVDRRISCAPGAWKWKGSAVTFIVVVGLVIDRRYHIRAKPRIFQIEAKRNLTKRAKRRHYHRRA